MRDGEAFYCSVNKTLGVRDLLHAGLSIGGLSDAHDQPASHGRIAATAAAR